MEYKNFCFKEDYLMIATEEDLNILSNSNDALLDGTEKIAIAEAAGYLNTKYDVDILFKEPVEYSLTDDYSKYDRIYTLSGETKMHYHCIEDGAPAGTSLDDTTYFTAGDSRDFKLLQVIMAMSLFYLHSTITPNNIPLFRVVAFDGNGNTDIMSAIKWLMMIQQGDLQPYGWIENTSDEDTIPDTDGDYYVDGSDPANGIMFGNIMGNDDFFHYNYLVDPNIKKIQTEEV